MCGVISYAKDDIGTISRQEGKNGWGDLTFGVLRPMNTGARTVLAPSRFAGIPDVREAEEVMFQTFKHMDVPPGPVSPPPVSFVPPPADPVPPPSGPSEQILHEQ